MTGRKETGRFIQNVGSQFITKFVPDKLILNMSTKFPGAKRPRRGADPHPNPHLAPRIRNSRAIPLHPCGPSWPVLGGTLLLFPQSAQIL